MKRPPPRPELEAHRMKTHVFSHRLILCGSVLLLASSLSPFSIHAEDGQVTGAMIVTPKDKLNEVASGAVEDTLKACLARIPDRATAGQRMLAERTCHGQEVVRKTINGPPQF